MPSSEKLAEVVNKTASLNKKRKFLPNVAKALAKKSSDSAIDVVKPEPKPSAQKKPRNSATKKNFKADDRYVQSYSLFESGVGVFEKRRCEIRESGGYSGSSSSTTVRRVVPEEECVSTTDGSKDVFNDPTNFISDIKQIFPVPPYLMKDVTFKSEELVRNDTSDSLTKLRSTKSPAEFFSKSQDGELFLMNLPDKILESNNLDGRLGKIQVMSDGSSRLVIDQAQFPLLAPPPEEKYYDVVRITDPEGCTADIQMQSLGSVSQFISAVPDLSRFSELGQ